MDRNILRLLGWGENPFAGLTRDDRPAINGYPYSIMDMVTFRWPAIDHFLLRFCSLLSVYYQLTARLLNGCDVPLLVILRLD